MSEMMEASYGQLSTMEEGEFAGWRYWQGDPFETRSGPFFHRREADGSYVSAFRAEARHMNGGGFMHGGCMLTWSSKFLSLQAQYVLDGDHAVTLNLSGDFLGPISTGALVEARGEVTRGGGKTIFVRGLITGDGQPALSFTGIIRRLSKR